jgi:hypothetical protein
MCLKKLLDFDVLDLSIICLLSPNGISQGIQGIIDFFSIVCLNVVASKAVIFVGHPDRHTWQYCRSL